MIIELDKTATDKSLQQSISRFKQQRKKKQKSNLSEFFGVLPYLEDGLTFQKQIRNEWD